LCSRVVTVRECVFMCVAATVRWSAAAVVPRHQEPPQRAWNGTDQRSGSTAGQAWTRSKGQEKGKVFGVIVLTQGLAEVRTREDGRTTPMTWRRRRPRRGGEERRRGAGLPACGGPVSRAWRHAMATSAPCALAAAALVGVEEGKSEARRGRVVAVAWGNG
jgi:hypothetical protein